MFASTQREWIGKAKRLVDGNVFNININIHVVHRSHVLHVLIWILCVHIASFLNFVALPLFIFLLLFVLFSHSHHILAHIPIHFLQSWNSFCTTLFHAHTNTNNNTHFIVCAIFSHRKRVFFFTQIFSLSYAHSSVIYIYVFYCAYDYYYYFEFFRKYLFSF